MSKEGDKQRPSGDKAAWRDGRPHHKRAQKLGCKIWSWWIGDGLQNAKIRTWSDASMQRKACDCGEVWCDRLILLMCTNTYTCTNMYTYTYTQGHSAYVLNLGFICRAGLLDSSN